MQCERHILPWGTLPGYAVWAAHLTLRYSSRLCSVSGASYLEVLFQVMQCERRILPWGTLPGYAVWAAHLTLRYSSRLCSVSGASYLEVLFEVMRCERCILPWGTLPGCAVWAVHLTLSTFQVVRCERCILPWGTLRGCAVWAVYLTLRYSSRLCGVSGVSYLEVLFEVVRCEWCILPWGTLPGYAVWAVYLCRLSSVLCAGSRAERNPGISLLLNSHPLLNCWEQGTETQQSEINNKGIQEYSKAPRRLSIGIPTYPDWQNTRISALFIVTYKFFWLKIWYNTPN